MFTLTLLRTFWVNCKQILHLCRVGKHWLSFAEEKFQRSSVQQLRSTRVVSKQSTCKSQVWKFQWIKNRNLWLIFLQSRSWFLRISLKFFRQTNAKLLQWFIYLVKPLLEIANSDFSRKFAPEVLIDPSSRRSGLHDSVEKPDFYGFLQKLEVFENYQYLVRKNS